MSQKKGTNKMIDNNDIQEYHFAGSGSHAPITVYARSQKEAEEKRDQKIGIAVVASGYEDADSHPSI